MTIHAVIDGTDLTPYIVDGSYNINKEDSSESWEDGNKLEHRIVIASKVKGSFDLACSNRDGGLSTFDLNALIGGATVSMYAVRIGLYVPTEGSFGTYDCYYSLTSKEHKITPSGEVDVVTLTLKER